MSKQGLCLLTFGSLCVLGVLMMTGCAGMAGPGLGIASIPVPVSPVLQNAAEDAAWERERYGKVPILDPIEDGHVAAIDEPSDDLVLRQLERVRKTTGTVPFLDSTYRNDIRIMKVRIADYVDEPRFFPMVGPAQLHHSHWKCTVYFTQVTNVGWPIPHTLKNTDASEVLYIDLDHLHRVGGPQGEFSGN